MLLCGKLRIALVCRGERSTFLLHPSPFRTAASESVMTVAADSWRPFSNRRYPKNEDKPVPCLSEARSNTTVSVLGYSPQSPLPG